MLAIKANGEEPEDQADPGNQLVPYEEGALGQ